MGKCIIHDEDSVYAYILYETYFNIPLITQYKDNRS